MTEIIVITEAYSPAELILVNADGNQYGEPVLQVAQSQQSYKLNSGQTLSIEALSVEEFTKRQPALAEPTTQVIGGVQISLDLVNPPGAQSLPIIPLVTKPTIPTLVKTKS